MNLKNQKRIAAQLLKVGKNKIEFDQSKLPEIKEAITKSDIRSLIASKIIKKKKLPFQSRASARKIKKQKSKGRRKGRGSRKGTSTSRLSRKRSWILKVRSQRKFIANLKNTKKVTSKVYRELYKMIKSNKFRTIRLIKLYLGESKLISTNENKKGIRK